jgi:DNA repair exonuclease SbcCD nuclease subunit
MSSKFLVIGDPHFKPDNIEQSQKFYDEIENLLKSRSDELHSVVILGDTLHTHEKIHTLALNFALNFISMITKYAHVYCLVGNHDLINNSVFLPSDLDKPHWLNCLKQWNRVTVVDSVISVKTPNDHTVVMCPYVPDGRFIEALNTCPGWKSSDLIFGHQLLDGAKMGAIIVTDLEAWQPFYPMCILGHVHDKQEVQPNLVYVGTPIQHAFGESGDKTVSIVSIEDGGADIEYIELNIKSKKILYTTLEELNDLKTDNSDIEYKIVIQDDPDKIKAFKKTTKFKELTESVKKVQFKSVERSEQFIDNVKVNNFEEVLMDIVQQRSDPMLDSFMRHVLYGTEDETEI